MNKKNLNIFFSLLISVVATVASLFFSEVMELVPCSLCWYQRILMYPLMIIFLIAFIKNDFKVYFYTNTLTFLGFVISFYHNLLVWGIIPEEASPCRLGIPCSATYIDWFGFINIPLLSLIAFIILLISGVSLMKHNKKKDLLP